MVDAMTKKRIYQCSLALPLLVPLLFSPLFFYLKSMGEGLATIVTVILYSGYIGGLPYITTAIPLFLWMRSKSESQIRKALLLSPILMLVPLLVWAVIYTFTLDNPVISREEVIRSILLFFLFYGVFTLVFGYAYVAVAFALGKLFAPEQSTTPYPTK